MASRRVQRHGGIKHQGQRYFVSHALAGWDVGLRVRPEGPEVYFCKLLLGTLETKTVAFKPVTMPLEVNN
jgi:hypothetical protein